MNKPSKTQLRANAAAASTKAGTVRGTNPQARTAALKLFEAAEVLRGVKLTIGDFKAYLSPALNILADRVKACTPDNTERDANTITVDSNGAAQLPATPKD